MADHDAHTICPPALRVRLPEQTVMTNAQFIALNRELAAFGSDPYNSYDDWRVRHAVCVALY